MSGVRESLLLLALFACGGGSAGADSDAGSAVVVPESGSSDSGDDSMSVDAASGAAASSSGSEGGSAARLDAAATCPSQAPQGIAPDFAAMICPHDGCRLYPHRSNQLSILVFDLSFNKIRSSQRVLCHG
jgi:hypothetical protein